MNNINMISREYFWQKSPNAKGLHLLAWDKITALKIEGGLGIQKFSLLLLEMFDG